MIETHCPIYELNGTKTEVQVLYQTALPGEVSVKPTIGGFARTS
jgi:hypothetical protein